MNLTTLLSLSVNATATDPKDLSTPQEDFVYTRQFSYENGSDPGEANVIGRGRITVAAGGHTNVKVTPSGVGTALKTPFNDDALFTYVRALIVVNRSATQIIEIVPDADGGGAFPWTDGLQHVVGQNGLFAITFNNTSQLPGDLRFNNASGVPIEVDVIIVGV